MINPSFTLTANTEVNGVKIQLYAAGRPREIKIELTSNPVMPESEILSLLALGLTATESKRLGSDRTVVEQGEAASLLLHSLDFNREVRNKTGSRDPARRVGELADRHQHLPAPDPDRATAAPRIVIRQELGKNVDLSYGAPWASAPRASAR